MASGLGGWRRAVINMSKEPGALACKAYLRVAHRVVTSAESAREEQSRVADGAAVASAAGPARSETDLISSDSDYGNRSGLDL